MMESITADLKLRFGLSCKFVRLSDELQNKDIHSRKGATVSHLFVTSENSIFA